nr:hypothetical protein GTC16762_01430 [Pigmentibacter ruber]
MKLLVIFILISTKLIAYSKDNLDNYFELWIGKKMCISNKRIIEIKNLSKNILQVKNNIINNKICIYPIKQGNGYLQLLLSDGRKKLKLVIHVLPSKKEKTLKKIHGKEKISIFDKNLKKKYVIDGWR